MNKVRDRQGEICEWPSASTTMSCNHEVQTNNGFVPYFGLFIAYIAYKDDQAAEANLKVSLSVVLNA